MMKKWNVLLLLVVAVYNVLSICMKPWLDLDFQEKYFIKVWQEHQKQAQEIREQ